MRCAPTLLLALLLGLAAAEAQREPRHDLAPAPAQPAAADFFQGAFQRPLLSIERPQNGEVLDSGELTIEVSVRGYELPSKLHGSRICLGLGAGDEVTETCFEQTDNLEFHASGLLPGSTYMLRVVLIERAHVVAVSVRSFRVGAVVSDDGRAVSIQTGLQMALSLHEQGVTRAAEGIYEQIITQQPAHADALHLLGVVHYQSGRPEQAIPYIERALATNSSFENFHNSLGECLRAVGRLHEAVSQYQLALSLRPRFPEAQFNLGLAWQQLGDLQRAVQLYDLVTDPVVAAAGGGGGGGGGGIDDDDPLAEANPAMLREARVRLCDLLLVQARFADAEECLIQGIASWPDDGHMHNELGNVYMEMGQLDRAGAQYRRAMDLAQPIATLNMAVLLEIASEPEESHALFAAAANAADAEDMPATHMRIKMATVLPRVMRSAEAVARARRGYEERIDALFPVVSAYSDNSEPLNSAFTIGYFLAFHGENDVRLKTKLARMYALFSPPLTTGEFLTPESIFAGTGGALSVPASAPPPPLPARAAARVRVGFVSRFFYDHAVGHIALGLIQHLSRSVFEVHVFAVLPTAAHADDPVAVAIRGAADHAEALPGRLVDCHRVLEAAELDILVYPELGMDPVTYFLAFDRLAPVQVAWWGHPDTTGVPGIDYFVSSRVELPEVADRHYSERLFRLRCLVCVFFERPALPASPLGAPLDSELVRGHLRAVLPLPKRFHLYLCVQQLFKLHPDFDHALGAILQADRLGHVFLLATPDRPSWMQQLRERFEAAMGADRARRVHFVEVAPPDLPAYLYAADVLLDPFPVSHSLHTTMTALAVGTPVVTLPGDFLRGRLALAFLRRLQLEDALVAATVPDYRDKALRLALDEAHRAAVAAQISERRDVLFEDHRAIHEWERFLLTVSPLTGS